MRKGDLILTIPNPHKNTIGIDLLIRILNKLEFQGKSGLEKRIPEKLE